MKQFFESHDEGSSSMRELKNSQEQLIYIQSIFFPALQRSKRKKKIIDLPKIKLKVKLSNMYFLADQQV